MAAKKKTKSKTSKIVKSVEIKVTGDKSTSAQKRSSKRKLTVKYLVPAVFLVLLGVLLYFGRGLFVAAIVGGKPITRLELVRQLEKESGKQALDNLVTKKLITSEAEKKGVQVSQEDVQKEIESISKLVESQGQTLDAALATQGQTRETLEENIRVQKTVEEILKDNLQVSDEDVSKYFESNKSLYGKDAKLEDLKGDIRQQLKQEKLSTAFGEWIKKLKDETKVIYFVNF